MKRFMSMIAAGLLLCGCTDADWDHLTSFDRRAPSETALSQAVPENPTPVPASSAQASPQPDIWCQQVAQDAGEKAARNGFDATTQQSTAQTSYRQCAALKSGAL